MSRDDWREMTDYLLGCDPSEPDIFKGPTTMTREQFEAHVRAEASKKHVLTADLPGIEYAKMMGRREAYIATRMEHEWPLVGFTAKLLEYWQAGNFSRHPWQMELQDILSAYTTKPIEP